MGQFDKDFMIKNPKYLGLTANCQLYVKALFDFLMEKGKQRKDLPPPESIGSLISLPQKTKESIPGIEAEAKIKKDCSPWTDRLRKICHW